MSACRGREEAPRYEAGPRCSHELVVVPGGAKWAPSRVPPCFLPCFPCDERDDRSTAGDVYRGREGLPSHSPSNVRRTCSERKGRV
jgi:hypothetical protein